METATITLKPFSRPRISKGGEICKPREGYWVFPATLERRKAVKILANHMILQRERKIAELYREIAILRREK